MISNRLLFGAGVAVCALLLSTGYYLQYFQGQDPCPLCLVQRGFFYAVLFCFGDRLRFESAACSLSYVPS